MCVCVRVHKCAYPNIFLENRDFVTGIARKKHKQYHPLIHHILLNTIEKTTIHFASFSKK